MNRILHKGLMLAGLCLAAAFLVVMITIQSRNRLESLTAQLSALRAKEAGLIAKLPAKTQSDMVNVPKSFAWPQDTLGAIELAMQEIVLNAAASANMTVQSFGSIGPDARCSITCPTYEVELEGGHSEVVAFLAALEQAAPPLSVNNLWMRQLPPDGTHAIAPISLRIYLWAIAPNIPSGVSQ